MHLTCNLSASLKKIPCLNSLFNIAKANSTNIWLVGGCLRDIYLNKGKVLIDFDFCVENKTLLIARSFAKEFKSRVIVLDKEQESFRVVLKIKDKFYSYDFTSMRDKDIISDLSLRDFSINTLALKLGDGKQKLIDHFHAKGDLDRGVIRVVRPEVIPQDPLRILRGFSFAANYNFRIDPKTLKLFSRFRNLINSSSSERISEELFKIFNCRYSFKIIKLMDKMRIIDEILPRINETRGVYQGSYHHLDVWDHSLECLRQFELFYVKKLSKNKVISSYLEEELARGRRRIQILKLACLLHDIGKPSAKKKIKKKTIFHMHEKIGRDIADRIARDLRLSLRERETLKRLIFWHLRPGYLADQIFPTKRAVYRFFRDTQNEGPLVIILSFSDWRATRGPDTSLKKRKRHEKIMLGLMYDYFAKKDKKPLRKIIDGNDVMRKFKITSGPLIGEILKKVSEEQALGKVLVKKEAYELASKMVKAKKYFK